MDSRDDTQMTGRKANLKVVPQYFVFIYDNNKYKTHHNKCPFSSLDSLFETTMVHYCLNLFDAVVDKVPDLLLKLSSYTTV